MTKKRRSAVKFVVNGALTELAGRVEDLERRVEGNNRSLEVQFERIARIQADVDRLRAHLKRSE